MKSLAIGSSLLCAAVISLSMSTAASASNLVINGGFEDTNLRSGTWRHYGVGQINGWTPTEGSRIEIRNNKVGTAYEGNNFTEVDSHAYDKNAEEVGLFQDIVTEIGQKYRLSFAYSPREQNKVNGDNLLSVSFGDLYQELDAGNNGDGWQLFNQTIKATSDVTQLKFLSLGKRDTLGANIDDVHLEAVPEPFSVLGLFAVGAVGATSAIRKRFTA
ncbi:MAG: PEP-CTERM sorting domain-containing protein [Leptolyngbya sp. SIO1D8]|nr:PEP-CTERM sorting domain-containing protein [Leptolyngbya sp. SIO1D8]